MVFNKAIPCLKVLDILSSVEFYQVKLGFDCLYQNKWFARLCIAEVELHLYVSQDSKGRDSQYNDWQLQECDGPIPDAYCRINVSDLHALYRAYQVTGAIDAATTKISRHPWGQNDFTVLDMCGNAIIFYEEAARDGYLSSQNSTANQMLSAGNR